MGCGSGMTCWRRLREWQDAGVWQRLHELLLAKLNEADRIDWSRAAIDSSHVRALGGRKDRPEPRRPLETRLQAPPDRLWPRHPARRFAHGRQPQRHHADGPLGGRGHAGARTPRAGHGGGRNGSTATVPITRASGAPSCAAVTSRRGSPGRRARTAPGSASSAGSSSARSPGCTSSGDFAAATNDAPTSTRRSWRSAAA